MDYCPFSEEDRDMPRQEIVRAVGRFVEAVNQGDMTSALASLTGDVTIVEDIAPYRWQGPGAGAEWMAAMAGNAEAAGMAGIVMEIGEPGRVEAEREQGYAVVPGILSLHGAEATLRAEGTLVFSLRREEGGWLISAFAWAGPAPRPEP
jgi:ketosteroid isomerase-like protein